MKLNINDSIKVKLNDHGMEILREEHEYYRERMPKLGDFVDRRDEDGYMKFQLWDFMARFGKHITLGSIPPFDTEIILEAGNE